jgi:hypothetical protein
MDVYRFGESDDAIEAEAIETFCVRPQCECNEVRVQFYEIGKDEEGHLGTVSIKVEEPVSVSMHVPEPNRAMLESFWSMYQKRHPNWVLRLAHRAEVMQQFGVRLHQKSQNAAKKPWVSASRKRQGKPKGTH